MPGNPFERPSDEPRLLERVRRMETAALGEVFDAYYRPLYRYLAAHLGHGQTAEDLAGEVFRVFLEQVRLGRGPVEQLRAWLYRVAHNLMVDELRRRRRRNQDPLAEDLLSEAPSPASQQQAGARREALQRALAKLSDKQRAVLVLKYLQGLENQEIARTLSLNVGTVRALQFRGLRALQRILENLEDMEWE